MRHTGFGPVNRHGRSSMQVLRIRIQSYRIGGNSITIINSVTTSDISMSPFRYTGLLTAAVLAALVLAMLATGCTGTGTGPTAVQGGAGETGTVTD